MANMPRGEGGGLPPKWEMDYDGRRWFYKHTPTGHVQYHFPSEGDEFPEFVQDGEPAPELTPEERLESLRQLKRMAAAASNGRAPDSENATSEGHPADPVGISAGATPVSAVWEDGDREDARKAVFQLENFMFLGPGTYAEAGLLNGGKDDDDEEARLGAVAGGTGEREKRESPVGNGTTTPTRGTESRSEAGPSLPPAEPAEADVTKKDLEVALNKAAVAARKEAFPFDPVGVMAEMPTEQTGLAHIERHPHPVEMADNSILAPIETVTLPTLDSKPGLTNAAVQGRRPEERHQPPSPRTRVAPSSRYASRPVASGNMARRLPDGAPHGPPLRAQNPSQSAYQAYVPGQSSRPPVPTIDDKRIRTSLQRNDSLMLRWGRGSASIDLSTVPKALSPPLESSTMLQKTAGPSETVERRGKDGRGDWEGRRSPVPSVLTPGRNQRNSTQALAHDQQARLRLRQTDVSPYQTAWLQQVENPVPTGQERPRAGGTGHRLAIAAPSGLRLQQETDRQASPLLMSQIQVPRSMTVHNMAAGPSRPQRPQRPCAPTSPSMTDGLAASSQQQHGRSHQSWNLNVPPLRHVHGTAAGQLIKPQNRPGDQDWPAACRRHLDPLRLMHPDLRRVPAFNPEDSLLRNRADSQVSSVSQSPSLLRNRADSQVSSVSQSPADSPRRPWSNTFDYGSDTSNTPSPPTGSAGPVGLNQRSAAIEGSQISRPLSTPHASYPGPVSSAMRQSVFDTPSSPQPKPLATSQGPRPGQLPLERPAMAQCAIRRSPLDDKLPGVKPTDRIQSQVSHESISPAGGFDGQSQRVHRRWVPPGQKPPVQTYFGQAHPLSLPPTVGPHEHTATTRPGLWPQSQPSDSFHSAARREMPSSPQTQSYSKQQNQMQASLFDDTKGGRPAKMQTPLGRANEHVTATNKWAQKSTTDYSGYDWEGR
ncbi:hypothetical protein E4U42_001164 [Claviceps africana]|uniref:WW domain-containing protein n=1 Tax=Claviceps africana TaxID=83212 RepID=A0A8K0NMZ8_9HYPO|nr:hypothetical protein E4U42_001164 [Claviceps africana]